MSQFSFYGPGPQQPMPPGMLPYSQRRSAARSARILMFVMGIVGIVIGTMAVAVSRYPLAQYPQAQRDQIDQTAHQLGISDEAFMTLMYMKGLRILIPGLLLVIFGSFVGRAGRKGIAAAIGLTGVLLAWLVVQFVGGLLTGEGPDFCGLFLVGAPLTVLLYWLKIALSQTTTHQPGDAQYMAQYMQAMQQWYAQNAGGGYPTQPPPDAIPPQLPQPPATTDPPNSPP